MPKAINVVMRTPAKYVASLLAPNASIVFSYAGRQQGNNLKNYRRGNMTRTLGIVPCWPFYNVEDGAAGARSELTDRHLGKSCTWHFASAVKGNCSLRPLSDHA